MFALLSAYKQIYDKKKQIKEASIDIFLIRVTSPHEEPEKKALLRVGSSIGVIAPEDLPVGSCGGGRHILRIQTLYRCKLMCVLVSYFLTKKF